MSASVEILSPSKHMIVVSPFNENVVDDQNNKMNEQEVEKENNNGSSNNNNNSDDIDEKNNDHEDNNGAALKESCVQASLLNSSSSSSSPKLSSSSNQQPGKEKNTDQRRLQKWKDNHLDNLSVNSPSKRGVQPDINKTSTTKPTVEIISISIKCRDRPVIMLSEPFASSPKACLFTLKEGSRYRLSFSFNVSNKSVSGLKYVNTLWKAGVRVDRSEVMLGSFNPKNEPYSYELEEDTAPSGIFVRGIYCARTKVVDDHDNCYLDIKYYFEIHKSWPSCS